MPFLLPTNSVEALTEIFTHKSWLLIQQKDSNKNNHFMTIIQINLLVSSPAKYWRIFREQSFTAYMPLLTATSILRYLYSRKITDKWSTMHTNSLPNYLEDSEYHFETFFHHPKCRSYCTRCLHFVYSEWTTCVAGLCGLESTLSPALCLWIKRIIMH